MTKICPKCGINNSEDAFWCTNCSTKLTVASDIQKKEETIIKSEPKTFDYEQNIPGNLSQSKDYIPYCSLPDTKSRKISRPFLVTVFAIGFIIDALLSIVLLALLVYTVELFNLGNNVVLSIVCFIILLSILFKFIIAFGLLTAKRWAWIFIIIDLGINIISLFGIFNFINIFSIIIDVIILILWTATYEYRTYFGMIDQIKKAPCPYCGHSISTQSKSCSHCGKEFKTSS